MPLAFLRALSPLHSLWSLVDLQSPREESSRTALAAYNAEKEIGRLSEGPRAVGEVGGEKTHSGGVPAASHWPFGAPFAAGPQRRGELPG